MHFHSDLPFSLTSLTAPPSDIKTKPSRLETPPPCLLSCGKDRPDLIKDLCISSRIGTWCSANRGLINRDNLINLFQALDTIQDTGRIDLNPFRQGQMLIQ